MQMDSLPEQETEDRSVFWRYFCPHPCSSADAENPERDDRLFNHHWIVDRLSFAFLRAILSTCNYNTTMATWII